MGPLGIIIQQSIILTWVALMTQVVDEVKESLFC